MNLDEFATRLNSEIVGKLVNIASRCAGFITKTSGGKLADGAGRSRAVRRFRGRRRGIADAYEKRDTAGAMRDIMALADRANQYVDSAQAVDARQAVRDKACRSAGCLHSGPESIPGADDLPGSRCCPRMAAKARTVLAGAEWTWASAAHRCWAPPSAYEALAVRLDPKVVAQLVEPAVSEPQARGPGEAPAPRTQRRWRRPPRSKAT